MENRELNNVNINVEFEETANRQQLSSGDDIKLLFGKTKKWFSDLKPVSLSGDFNDLSNKPKSIESITSDSNNNIIVRFSDGTTQNIGQLNVDIQANFLTSEGFGNLRYYNRHFQYCDTENNEWVDTNISPENVYIINMEPQPMQYIYGVYDTELKRYKLRFKEPGDTIINGQSACVLDKVIIRRKLNSVPTDENDGSLVIEVLRKDFGNYQKEWYIDEGVIPNNGEIYYYKAFPKSTIGFFNQSSINEVSILCKDYNLYGFRIDQSESNPESMITYIEDNISFPSAYMNYAIDTFDYGAWDTAWFIKKIKPCMLKYDGTVDYELNPNDYSKKLDGTESDIFNDEYEGNVMIGIPKVYWKIIDNCDNTADVLICDKKIDNDFHCWSHLDNYGNEINYCYMAAYNGSIANNKLRSLSGKIPITNQMAQTEIQYAKENNLTDDIIWYTDIYSDRTLINLLLLLIGKSTDTQTVFGNGNNNSYVSTSNNGIKETGTMNTKGLFWGNTDNKTGVKVFGIEHYWGNRWDRIAGLINDNGIIKVKMTYGQSDGSNTVGYNMDGSGYIAIPDSTPSGTNNGYISKMKFTDNAMIPSIVSGSATTYYTDGLWYDNSQNNYALMGGTSSQKLLVGALYLDLDSNASYKGWDAGANISCKPFAIGGEI